MESAENSVQLVVNAIKVFAGAVCKYLKSKLRA